MEGWSANHWTAREFLHIVIFYFHCSIIFHEFIYHNLFIHYLIDGHLGCFQLETIMNSSIRNIYEQFFAEHMNAFLLGISRNGIAEL